MSVEKYIKYLEGMNLTEKEGMVELMVLNWNQLLSKFIFLQKHLLGNT